MLSMQIYLSHFSPSRLIHLLAVVMFFSGTTRVHEHLCDIPLQPRFPQGAATPFHNAVTQMGLSLQCQLFCLHICNHTHRGSCHHPGVSVEVEYCHFSHSAVCEASWVAFISAN